MRKWILAIGLLTFSSAILTAQTTTIGDYKKGEVFVGYSNGQIDTGVDSGSTINDFFRDRETFHGFEISGVYNLGRYFGLKGDFSAHFNSNEFNETITDGTTVYQVRVDNDNKLYNFLGGIQAKDNSIDGRFKPFAHAMIGVGHARSKFKNLSCTVTPTTTPNPCPVGFVGETFSDTGLAGALGGGIDIRVGDRFQIRAIQVDYNPVRVGGYTNHNVRIGAGIVF